jgi:hypothetical protein
VSHITTRPDLTVLNLLTATVSDYLDGKVRFKLIRNLLRTIRNFGD